MATFKPVVLNGFIKSDGTTNVKIRVYHNKVSLYIPTPYYIFPGDLGRDGNIISTSKHADLTNYQLGKIIQNYRAVILKLGADRVSRMSCEDLKDCISSSMNLDSEYIDFVGFSRGVIEETKKKATAEWYEVAINVLCWYYKRQKMDVRDITSDRINEFARQLSDEGPSGKPLTPGAISNYLRAIRSLFNKAREKYNNYDLDIIRIPNDPFKKVKIPKYKRSKKSLSIDVIKRIRDTEYTTKRANMARDVFMIMFYTMGINASDLYKLRRTKKDRIEYYRSKTDTDDNVYQILLSIKIEPELDVLLKKYSDIDFLSFFRRKYCVPYNFYKAVNKGLERICEELELPYNITTNWARHSWASIARNKADVSKADIDFCLGHVNNDHKMADIYIDVDYSIYDKANRKVLDLLKKKSPKTQKKV